jgi:hypothetical protein
VATILHFIPMIAIMLPFYLLLFVVPLLMVGMTQDGEPNPAMPILFIVIIVFFGIVMVALMMVVNIAFTFVYPLIVDRKLSGFDAAKLTARAALANFWPLLGMMFLVLPITFAAMAVAYSQVFGLGNVQSTAPPPPPVFS